MNINWIGSPHSSSRQGKKIEAIVIHYTGGGSAEGTAKWFRNPASRRSAHFVISRRGYVIQCVALKNAAWHAGRSKLLDGSTNVNQKTIGIELANRGYLLGDDPTDLWYERGGDIRKFKGNAQQEIYYTKKHYWEIYTGEQIEALQKLLEHLKNKQGVSKEVFEYICGHEEIAKPVGRKQDPGPLFPWDRFRKQNSGSLYPWDRFKKQDPGPLFPWDLFR